MHRRCYQSHGWCVSGKNPLIQEGQHWRRLNDDEVVELADKQSYRTEEAPVFRSAPRLTVD
jgi:hypothetical protein